MECILRELDVQGLTMCNSRVMICPTEIPVSLISKWEKSSLWIEPQRGENPYKEVGFVFTSVQGHIPSRSYEIGALRGGNLCIRF